MLLYLRRGDRWQGDGVVARVLARPTARHFCLRLRSAFCSSVARWALSLGIVLNSSPVRCEMRGPLRIGSYLAGESARACERTATSRGAALRSVRLERLDAEARHAHGMIVCFDPAPDGRQRKPEAETGRERVVVLFVLERGRDQVGRHDVQVQVPAWDDARAQPSARIRYRWRAEQTTGRPTSCSGPHGSPSEGRRRPPSRAPCASSLRARSRPRRASPPSDRARAGPSPWAAPESAGAR
jgi:hypothetical protein